MCTLLTKEAMKISTIQRPLFGGSFGSEKAKFSPDGKKIAFYSDATNLVASDTNGTLDLFVKNLETGLVQRVSTKSNGEQISDPFPGKSLYDPVFSPDGSKIAFVTKSPNFVANDTSGQYDVFLKDLNTGAVTRVSTTSDGSEAIGGGSFNPVFSPNGKLLAFASEATNFAQSDKNGKLDVFIKTIEDGGDYQGGVGSLRRVSVDFNGKEGLGDSGQSISFSPDSKTIAFSSLVSTFVSGDTNEASDIFIKDIATNNSSGAIVRVSTDKGGVQLKSGSYDVKFVSDHYVSFKNGDNVYLKHLNNYDANDTGINKVTIPVDGSSGATTTEYIGTNQVVQVLSLDGLKSDYSIAYADLSLSPSLSAIPLNITDQVASRNGAFKTTYVERLNFDDVSTAFDLSGKAGQLHALYDALLNRTGDEVGLGFWLSQLDSGKPLSEVAQAFLASPEYKAAGSKTNADFVDMLYSHGLERPADAAGKAYWVDLLNNGKATLADVAVSFASSAEQMAQTIPEVGAKGLDYQVWAM